MEQAHPQALAQFERGRFSLALKLTDHPGLQGIVAQRLGEKYHRPTVAFIDLEDGTLAGSGRSILEELDLRAVFQWMEDQQPGLFLTMGGHRGAAGCMIAAERFDLFSELLEAGVRHALDDQLPVPILLTDGALSPAQLHPDLIAHLNTLAPYGQGWPAPLFDNVFEVRHARIIGKDRTHLHLQLRLPGQARAVEALFFGGQQDIQPDAPPTFSTGMWIRAVYRPVFNHFAGRQQFQLRVLYAEPATSPEMVAPPFSAGQ